MTVVHVLGHPSMGGPMQRMTPPRGMVPLGPQVWDNHQIRGFLEINVVLNVVIFSFVLKNYGGGMRPPLNALVGPGMPGMTM